MIVTIDGPAGTGKSTVAQAVAARLGAAFLDTGAMYRTIGLAAMRAGVPVEEAEAVGRVAERVTVGFDFSATPPRVLLDGEAVGELIRAPDVTRAASVVAAVPAVRAVLVREQQRIGREYPNLVTEGRDQGTVVFPQADVKFYLDAAPEERARRRVEQLRSKGQAAEYDEVLREIIARDKRDAGRAVGPLKVPEGAIVVDTTGLSPREVIDRIVGEVLRAKGQGGGQSMRQEPSLLWKTLWVPSRILTTTLFDLKVYGAHHVPREGGVLLVANHQSYLDPVLLGVQICRPLSYMAKSELFEHRAFAWLIRSLNAFPVRQGEGDKAAIETTIRELQAGKMLLIFPEGSLRTPDGQIAAMERGIALVIRRAKVPVVPAVVDGSFEAWKDRKIFQTWPIAACYGPPMDFSGMDRERITTVVGSQLRGMFDALREQRRRRDGVNPAELDATVFALSQSLMMPTPAKASPAGKPSA